MAGREWSGPGAGECTDRRQTRTGRSVVENHALAGAHDIVQDRFRQRRPGHGLVAELHEDRIAAGRGFRRDPLLGQISKPRSAPACSIAVRISVSISFSSTISPETVCDTLITVARSRRSTGVAIVFVGPGDGLFGPEVRIHRLELPHLAVGAPAAHNSSGRCANRDRAIWLEPARPVEVGRALIGDRLVVDEAIVTRRTGWPVRRGARRRARGPRCAQARRRPERRDSRNSRGNSSPIPHVAGGAPLQRRCAAVVRRPAPSCRRRLAASAP